MTEPVAYLVSQEPLSSVRWLSDVKPIDVDDKQITPLYTSEQLHPRVKMTKKQYDRLMWDKENTDLFQCIDYFNEHDGNSKFGVLTENLKGDLTKEDIARAWLNPEETIEIAPDMKWFVRSKERNLEKNYYYFVGKRPTDYWPNYGYKRAAKQFDTKEEAEKWTNPDTEAVHLPVEVK